MGSYSSSTISNKANIFHVSLGAVTARGLANINQVVAQYLFSNNVGRVYVISDATTYSDGLANDFAASAKRQGLTVLGQISVTKRSDFAAPT